MANRNEHNRQHTNGLATEKDIDPEFGLFTEEEEVTKGAVPDASEQLIEKYPEENEHIHESHVPEALNARGEVDTPEEISEELAAVPDADHIAKDSPIDPASPGEEFHGTDLLNGVGHHPEEETEEL